MLFFTGTGVNADRLAQEGERGKLIFLVGAGDEGGLGLLGFLGLDNVEFAQRRERHLWSG